MTGVVSYLWNLYCQSLLKLTAVCCVGLVHLLLKYCQYLIFVICKYGQDLFPFNFSFISIFLVQLRSGTASTQSSSLLPLLLSTVCVDVMNCVNLSDWGQICCALSAVSGCLESCWAQCECVLHQSASHISVWARWHGLAHHCTEHAAAAISAYCD